MSVQKKDKEKVLDEVWNEERIRSFLDILPPDGLDRDFHALNTAYKSMRLEDFETFVTLFVSAKRNLHAKNTYGESTLDVMKQHRHGVDYARILENAGQ